MDLAPIILIHGIARFDWLHEGYRKLFPQTDGHPKDRSHYFRNVGTHLKSHGYQVFHASLSYAKRSEQRAAELGEQIEQIRRQTGAAQVHLIAHSMGGIDARRLIITQTDLAKNIASLTTIGTPHLGSSLADWGLAHGGNKFINLAEPLLDLSGFADLTLTACTAFNQQAEPLEAANAIRYRVCASHASRRDTLLPLRPSWSFLQDREGDNDGLVSVKSQLWTKELHGPNGLRKRVESIEFPFPADHLSQTGWWDPSKRDREKSLTEITDSIREFEGKIQQMYLDLVRGLT
ncbi:MAG: lip [Verrucomicrobia bacterium]|jgi:triacylglycerol lipase|nr:lip [Verrucomicrobiota bacterium]